MHNYFPAQGLYTKETKNKPSIKKMYEIPIICVFVFYNLCYKQITGNAIIYQFDPITGAEVNGGITQLNYEVKQFSILQPNEDFMKGVLLLDRNNQLHVIPENVAELVK